MSEQLKANNAEEDRVLNIIGAELQQATNGTYTSEIDHNREQALDYYMGNLPGPAPDGRSQVVSTDVADAVEWILPSILKALVSKGPVITFDAISEADEEQANLESEYVHDVFMAENEGFLNLYEFTKDALIQKNGILKIYYDDTPETSTEEYTGITEQQLQMMLANPEVEPIRIQGAVPAEAQAQHTMQMQQFEQQMMQFQQMKAQMPKQPPQRPQRPQPPQEMFDVEIEVTHSRGRVKVECVAPEEFRVNEFHNSLDLSTARFVAHVTMKTRSELIEEGYDAEVINDAPVGSEYIYQREHRFAVQGETSTSSENQYSEDSSQDLLEVSECYIHIDLDETGVAELHKITVLGGTTPDTVLDVEQVEEMPFVSSSCIVMPHKFYGLSEYDKLKMIQDQKTSLWRNILDNLYFQNNREKEVLEGQVNLDDLLISRPGGIKRVKTMGSIRELQVQPIGQEGYQMLEYLDTVRTGRSGVSPDTMGAGPVENDTAHGVERIMTAKEELTGLMIRVVAETGVKAAYRLIRDLLVRHKDATEEFKYRGSWAKVNPSSWGRRSRTSVMVGTGTGDDSRKQAALSQVLMYQEKLASVGSPLVDNEQGFNALDEFCEVTGLNGGEKYFLDPKSKQGQQAIQEYDKSQQEQQQKMDEMNQKMAKAQEDLSKAEIMKGQAALQSQQAKLMIDQTQVESDRAQLLADATEADLKLELEGVKQELETAKAAASQEFDYAKLEADNAVKLAQIESNEAIAITKMELEAKKQMDDEVARNKDRDRAKEQGEQSTDED